MQTTQELIQKLGGPTKIGRFFNIRPQAVSIWVAKERIPAERLPALVRMAKEQGFEVNPEEIRSDIDWAALK